MLKDKDYCTITTKNDTIRVPSEIHVNDITAENTEVLMTRRNDKPYESYTYGINRIKTASHLGNAYLVSNGKLDIIASIQDNEVSWYDYDINGNSIDINGNIVPSKSPDAHIPLD